MAEGADIDPPRVLAGIAICPFHWEHAAFGTAMAGQSFRFGLMGVELFLVIRGFEILLAAGRARSIHLSCSRGRCGLYPGYLA